MDEEQINELSRLAEEFADQGFENIDNGTTAESDISTFNEDVIEALLNNEVRADVPISDTRDITIDGPTVILGEGLGDTSDPFIQASDNSETDSTDEPVANQEDENRDFIVPNVSISSTEEVTRRFSSADWFEKMKEQEIILAGLGGIGSWTSLLLGRCHPARILLFDDDIVTSVNMAGQLFSSSNVGEEKVHVCTSLLRNYCNYYNTFQYRRYEDPAPTTRDIMICGFDNMASRKLFYNKWKRRVMASLAPEKCLYLDGRLNAEEWQVFAIRGTDRYRMKKYEEEWLFEDNEVEEALCSYKQTSFCASMIASFIVNVLVNFVTNLCNPPIERDIPFLTEYDASLMYLKTIQ